MSQLVACLHSAGIVLAADRRVVVGRGGDRSAHSVRKLFPLGPSAAVATSGAAVGIMVSRTLSRLLRRRARFPFLELEEYTVSVFQKEYDEFVRQGAKWFAAHPEAHRLSYVLLAGSGADGEFALRFYASEAHGQPYRSLPTGSTLTAPRRIGLEGRLDRAIRAGTGSDDLCGIVAEGLRLVASKDQAVAGPFDLAVIDSGGVRVFTDDGSAL